MKSFNMCEKFKPLIDYLIEYYCERNAAGGWLHVVLDDGNVSDADVWSCQEVCERTGDDLGYLIATILRYFTESEREAIIKRRWKK